MEFQGLITEETKVTSQHQITIPKPIWEKLKLREGIRFSIFLTENNDILGETKRRGIRII